MVAVTCVHQLVTREDPAWLRIEQRQHTELY
jgi:hypothetical protein